MIRKTEQSSRLLCSSSEKSNDVKMRIKLERTMNDNDVNWQLSYRRQLHFELFDQKSDDFRKFE